MELKEKELKNELENHNVTNEYLLDQLHQVKSLESKLALDIGNSSPPLRLPSPIPSTSKGMQVLQTPTLPKVKIARKASNSTDDDFFEILSSPPLIHSSAKKRLSLPKENQSNTPTSNRVTRLYTRSAKNLRKN
ncbi:hypothetical protein DAPPUDRAFT_108175 [Daphnia pulex]|uniref:Uncharacterized protein n=1 Tax=Daphnia pulex TaxID=6669 RepID=E9GZD6_DAPPU|nr:hypothetical protein DAPPUDRAFT_108175 [Daphnia pulex]|eukprot:EFX75179.1 hypothetical protein DAPPUDRAFT_108175 [Daphnia pulex]